jgi:hypothetical protein
VTRTFREALLLAAGTIALYFAVALAAPRPTLDEWGAVVATASVWLLYLPCVIMVLRRPNEGPYPDIPGALRALVGRR